jgi:hypothetical protein
MEGILLGTKKSKFFDFANAEMYDLISFYPNEKWVLDKKRSQFFCVPDEND